MWPEKNPGAGAPGNLTASRTNYMTMSGRIMSCSSCSRMWQCHTYSLPPVRGLGGTSNGTDGRSNFIKIRVTVPGYIGTVSFQPVSFAAGGTAGPVNLADTPLKLLT